MSAVVSTLITAMKAQASTALGPTFRELGYVTDIAKNSFRQNASCYGFAPRSATQTEGVNQRVTMAQDFELVLTSQYSRSDVSDTQKQSITNSLYESAFLVYKQLVNTKAGSPSNVMNILDLNIASPEYLEEEKVVALRATFTVIYRISL